MVHGSMRRSESKVFAANIGLLDINAGKQNNAGPVMMRFDESDPEV